MRLFRYALIAILFVILGVAIQQSLLWLGAWGNASESHVKTLVDGEQEIALIEPATSMDDWGRIITALKLLKHNWTRINPNLPALELDLEDAFPDRTAMVPEITLSMSGSRGQRLSLRWYKISAEHDAAAWVRKLRARARPPLAVIGGGTSDRAVRLADSLQAAYPDPAQRSPVFVITTATAEKTAAGEPLISIYQSRSFRFSFTNQKMVEALLKFVQVTPNLWVRRPVDEKLLANSIASMAGAGDVWHSCAVLASHPHLQPYVMHAVSWQDERYSQDMADLFEQEFRKRNPLGEFTLESPIRHGVGGFFDPNPQEKNWIDTFLAKPALVAPNSFLVLPTQTVRMRRFLIHLRERSLPDARNLVILNGDAVSFHSIYRDRDVMWNILNVPYSLVFFAHRNPIDESAGFVWTKDEQRDVSKEFPPPSTTGTHDILLYRDIFEALLYAAFDKSTLLADTRLMRQRLEETCWYHPANGNGKDDSARVCNLRTHELKGEHERFFDEAGNRKSHTGEHIVWVRPNFTGDRVDLTSKISVWSMLPHKAGGGWQRIAEHDASYSQNRLEDIGP